MGKGHPERTGGMVSGRREGAVQIREERPSEGALTLQVALWGKRRENQGK